MLFSTIEFSLPFESDEFSFDIFVDEAGEFDGEILFFDIIGGHMPKTTAKNNTIINIVVPK
jgi:hypothetical protein